MRSNLGSFWGQPPFKIVVSQMGYEWRYGDGTRNPQGDYYYDGVYIEQANFLPEEIINVYSSAQYITNPEFIDIGL